MKSLFSLLLFAILITGSSYLPQVSTKISNKEKTTVKLYVFDNAVLENIDPTRFGLKKEDVDATKFAVPVFLVVHPKGTLIWDTGTLPDNAWAPYQGKQILYKLALPDRIREITMIKPVGLQLKEIGYSPDKITYLALSHYHYDHTGNANLFANSTWLVRQKEYDAMFAEQAPDVTLPSSYSALRNSKRQIIDTDEYDVFGDGTVIIKSAPGHTPGHQVLFLKLAKTGNIVLSGDLYHYIEEKTFDKVPTFEFNAEQTRTTRKEIDEYIEKKKAKLWIQHDVADMAKLKKAPAFYE